MLTFLITTSTKLASISLYKNDFMLGSIAINIRKTHSTSIVEQVESIFKWTGTKLSDVENVVVSTGPGSFTGVRIAMSLIKGMFTLDKDVNIYKVNELDALNFKAKKESRIVVSGIDSRKGKIYATVRRNDEILLKDSVYRIDEIVEYVNKFDEEVVFIGDIYLNYIDIIKHPKLKKLNYSELNIDTRIYNDMFLLGMLEKTKIDEIVPEYLEKCQAEKDYDNGNIKG